MAKKDRFMCWIMVPAYVKLYLLRNYQVEDNFYTDLVNINSDKILNVMFRHRLIKQSTRYDSRLESIKRYRYRCHKIAIEISKDDFYRHGWSLSATDESSFVTLLENRCKSILISYLASVYMLMPNLTDCIEEFYKAFGYDEESWPSDSIRRIWTREKNIDKNELRNIFSDKINKIIMVQLSRNGTISQKGLESYENDLYRK